MSSENSAGKTAKDRRWRLTRRGFLIGTGILGGGLALGIGLGLPYGRLQIARMLDNGSAPGSMPADPLAWFEILPDNRVRLFLSKAEMGQGIHTALAQIGAEELAVTWEQLEVVQAGTHTGPVDTFGTGGSNSVSSVYEPLRQAAAVLREMLRADAALALDQPAAALIAREGAFEVEGDAGQRITYGEVIAYHQANPGREWHVPEETPPLKPVDEYTMIGQSKPRVDIPAKVNGQAIYGYDVRMDDMLYGVALHAPTIEGKLLSAVPGDAAAVEGVVQVVIEDGFAGAVASSRQAARNAVGRIAAEWDPGKRWQQAEIDALVTISNGGGVTIQREGNSASLLKEQTSLVAEYRSPLAVHAALEPQAALAHVTPEKATIWCSTQFQSTVQGEIAGALGMAEDQVEVIPTYLGGGFGRKLNTEAALEAAKLSKAVGKPVHVGWDRNEEMRFGYFRPPTYSKLYGRLDENGQIVAMEHRQSSGDVAFPFFPAIASAVLGADFGAWRGATIHYGGVPNRQTVAWRARLPIRTGWWRGLGLLANTFAVESFVDELATLAGSDPLAFRLAHLAGDDSGQRMAAVLTRAAEMANWGGSLPAGHGLGLACCTDVDTTVAQVAEVSLEGGQVRVHNVWAAMDPGLVINPNGAAAQVEGSVMMALSSTLLEEVIVADGEVVPSNFDRYPLLTMKEAPHVEVALLEAADRTPRGVGEPPMGPVAAAVANALYAATGKRIRQLPFTRERIAAV